MARFGRLELAAALGVVAVGVTAWLFEHDLEPARRASRQGARIAQTRMGPIEYAERGSGPVLLSIHGAGGGFDQGLANVADFIGPDHRVIAPSRFGYLGTPSPPDRSPAAQADAHAALLQALKVDKAVVVGVSAGARSAVELAIRRPDLVQALILIVPGTYAPASPVMVDSSPSSRAVLGVVNAGSDFAWWAAERLAPSALVRFLGVPPELLEQAPPAERERVMAIMHSIQPLSRRMAGIRIDSTPDLHPLPLERIAAPTLIVSARDDLFNTAPAARYAAERIPGAKLVLFDTGGHLLVGRSVAVRRAVGELLSR